MGVPQGSTLGPILFIIYINDETKYIDAACIHLYANDIAITGTANTSEEMKYKLETQLQSAFHWLSMNKQSLNFMKTKYMIFGTNNTINKIQEKQTKVNDIEIERIHKFKYLCAILDPKLRFNEHVSYIRSKVIPRLNMLEKWCHTPGRNAKLTFHKTLVCPLFDYADVIYNWLSQLDVHLLQKPQNSALRLILNCDKNTLKRFKP